MVIFTALAPIVSRCARIESGTYHPIISYGTTAGGCSIRARLRSGAALLPGYAAPPQSPAVSVRVEQEAWRLCGAQWREFGVGRADAGRARRDPYRCAVPFLP